MLSEIPDHLRKDPEDKRALGRGPYSRRPPIPWTGNKRLRGLRERARGGLAGRRLGIFSENGFWKPQVSNLVLVGSYLLRSKRSRQVGCWAGSSSKSV